MRNRQHHALYGISLRYRSVSHSCWCAGCGYCSTITATVFIILGVLALHLPDLC
jgi:hypothetical protein